MSAADIAIIAENVVILAVVGGGWHLLRQGGGLQVKTPPVPKRQPQPAADTGTVEDLSKRRPA
jgi:hypothetical protein